MVTFVQTQEEFDAMRTAIAGKRLFVVPIFCDHRKHTLENTLSIVYIESDNTQYCISFHHNELTSTFIPALPLFDETTIVTCPSANDIVFSKLSNTGAVYDTTDIEYLYKGSITPLDDLFPQVMRSMHRMYKNQSNVNVGVPVMKLIEYCEEVVCHMKTIKNSNSLAGLRYLNSIPSSVALRFIEQSGIAVDAAKFEKYFKIPNKTIVYSQYNTHTVTGRASNTFDGVNYAALNKSNGSRSAFISRFGEFGALVLIDFESFHLRIIGDLIGHDFGPEPVHRQLAKQYFHTDNPTDEQYAESKRNTFLRLYHDMDEDTIEFFIKVNDIKTKLFRKMKRDGYLDISGRIIRNEQITDMTGSKLFNYMTQTLETQLILNAVNKIAHLWKDNSKIIMYTYDSLLFDFDMREDKSKIVETVRIMEQGEKFPVRIYSGNNYNEMVNRTELIKKSL